MSPRSQNISIRLDDEIEKRINEVIGTITSRSGIKQTRTSVIEAALLEGLKILEEKFKDL